MSQIIVWEKILELFFQLSFSIFGENQFIAIIKLKQAVVEGGLRTKNKSIKRFYWTIMKHEWYRKKKLGHIYHVSTFIDAGGSVYKCI